jgi:hypothetical protein
MIHQLTAQTVALIAVIAGAAVNPITSFLKKEKWPTQAKQALSFAVCAAITCAAIAIDQRSLFTSGVSVFALLGIIYFASQVIYVGVFHGSIPDQLLTAVFSKPAAVAPVVAEPVAAAKP